MRIRFLSSNQHKIDEARRILHHVGVEVVPLRIKIEEIQSADMKAILRDKVAKGFHEVGFPLFVEQTGLFIDQLNGFPGGLTEVFWETLKADRVAELFGSEPNNRVKARTEVAYCDGKSIHHFAGEISGTIASHPCGDRAFQWDCIFVPEGQTRTFAEMGEDKNEISMRRLALDELAKHLMENRYG